MQMLLQAFLDKEGFFVYNEWNVEIVFIYEI